MLFRIKEKSGPHYEGKRMFKAGDIVDSKKNLAQMWPNKFEALQPIQAVVAPTAQATPVQVDEEAPEAAEAPELGNEVTDQFPVAGQKGLQVFRRVAKFSIVDQSNPTTVLATFNSRRKVDEYLDEY